MRVSDLETMVGSNENIVWRGKPDKTCFVLESIFNPMLPFAIVWGFIDFFVIGASFFGSQMSDAPQFLIFLIPFMLVHMMPVWIYLGGVLLCIRRYQNTEYIITDRGIYVSGGTFSYTYEMKPFTDLSHINLHRGIFDQMFGVGDVISICSHTSMASTYSSSRHSHGEHGLKIVDIKDYKEVYKLIKDMQTDIYSDTMFPNDMRPGENHGYRTQYTRTNMYSNVPPRDKSDMFNNWN